LKKLYARLTELGYKLTLSDKAKAFIADKGFDKQFGARPLKEPFKNMLKTHLPKIITSKISSGDEIWILKKELRIKRKVNKPKSLQNNRKSYFRYKNKPVTFIT
jgi:ATP-dependent Clp protease ATP-binding subunit ClpC